MKMWKLLGRRSRLAGIAVGLMSVAAPGIAAAAKEAGTTGKQSVPSIPASSRGSGVAALVLQERLSELITTSGQASISLQPDAMRVELGVEVRAKTAEQARDELAQKMEHVTRSIRALSRKDLVVRTSLLELSPVEERAKEGAIANIVGYRARNILTITLRDVSPKKLGAEAAAILDAGVSAGANTIEGIAFFLSHPEQARSKALSMAAEDAERNARILASASNVELRGLHSLEGNPERPGFAFLADRASGIAGELTVEPGEITIQANVTARFHFAKK